jgi:hypothetical protein
VRDYASHLENYFVPSILAELDPFSLRLEHLRAFQLWLVSRAGESGTGISEKSAANAVRGTVRAFLRDIGATDAMAALEYLVWERYEPKRKQDPFTAR